MADARASVEGPCGAHLDPDPRGAAEAYGERDPAKVKDVPMAQFRKQKIQPQVGLELSFQGQRGVVTRVGRVRRPIGPGAGVAQR